MEGQGPHSRGQKSEKRMASLGLLVSVRNWPSLRYSQSAAAITEAEHSGTQQNWSTIWLPFVENEMNKGADRSG